MNISTKKNSIEFHVENRINVHTKSGQEWALNGHMGESWWNFICYTKEPSEKQLKRDKELILRSFEIYHAHIYIPPFKVIEHEY